MRDERRLAGSIGREESGVLKFRLISGVLIGAAFLALALFAPPAGLCLVLVLVSAFAQLEFYRLANFGEIPVFRYFGVVFGMALITVTALTVGPAPEQLAAAHKWQNVVLMISLLVVFIRQFPQKNNDKPIATIACTLLGIWYVPFLLNFFTYLALEWTPGGFLAKENPTGKLLVLYPIIVVKMSDIGAYFTGRAMGRHKLFLRISPGKTWEGLAGGTVASLIASVLFVHFNHYQLGTVQFGLTHAIALGVLLALVGVVGDMFESLLKRASGLKDSSALIPGMGGILDVLDSLLFTAPVFYMYLRLFVS
ncbi:MAG: hypothetical protein C0404_07200 [Verrucomicrobia bacterium]|nr:hypothetical protein [Verrucomicrobiota bacterium]